MRGRVIDGPSPPDGHPPSATAFAVTDDVPDAISRCTAQTAAEPSRGAGAGTCRGVAGIPGSPRVQPQRFTQVKSFTRSDTEILGRDHHGQPVGHRPPGPTDPAPGRIPPSLGAGPPRLSAQAAIGVATLRGWSPGSQCAQGAASRMPAGADVARLFHTPQPQTYVRVVGGGGWRQDVEYAWQVPDPEPDEGPGLTWRQLTLRHWSGTWDSKTRGTVTRYGDGRVANLRLEDPPGLSPIHRRPFDTVEAVQSLPTRCGRRGDPHRTAAVRVLLIARGTVGTLPLRLSCCG
jgi:hypothetical protein